MIQKRLVLASTSPRRIALLKSLGYCFDVIPHEVEENINDMLPDELVLKFAFMKALCVAKRVDDSIIIGADTIVVQDKYVFGKPRDLFDARRILLMLSNKEHEVISGICMIDMPSEKNLLRVTKTHVKMRKISEKEIDVYVKSGEPMNKAGAYAIQGDGGKFVEKIDGSYTNVIGLPLETLQEMFIELIKNTNAQKF